MQKPIIYAEIPDTFDQTTQYIVQKQPVDMGDHVFCDVEIRELPQDEGESNEWM